MIRIKYIILLFMMILISWCSNIQTNNNTYQEKEYGIQFNIPETHTINKQTYENPLTWWIDTFTFRSKECLADEWCKMEWDAECALSLRKKWGDILSDNTDKKEYFWNQKEINNYIIVVEWNESICKWVYDSLQAIL